MNKRLIAQQNVDRMDEELADLFRAAAPFQIDPFRKRRVLVSMQRKQAGRSASFWLRPAVVAALLISGTAAAALGQRYVANGATLLGLVASPPSSARTLTVSHSHARVAARLPAAKQVEPEMTDAPKAPAEVVEPPAPTRSIKHARPDASEDASRVVAALKALRTERDPARARGLLDSYLKSQPNGALSEDALALSIEAASAEHDPRAADYARRYLAKFSRGKYRDLAVRALGQVR